MKTISAVFLAITVLPLFLGAQAQNTAPARYTAIDLGTLGGVFGSSAHSINNKGWVAGVANLSIRSSMRLCGGMGWSPISARLVAVTAMWTSRSKTMPASSSVSL